MGNKEPRRRRNEPPRELRTEKGELTFAAPPERDLIGREELLEAENVSQSDNDLNDVHHMGLYSCTTFKEIDVAEVALARRSDIQTATPFVGRLRTKSE